MAKDRIESKYVTVAPGVELHILEKGEGKPLVFIPGLTFSGEIFKNQLEYALHRKNGGRLPECYRSQSSLLLHRHQGS